MGIYSRADFKYLVPSPDTLVMQTEDPKATSLGKNVLEHFRYWLG